MWLVFLTNWIEFSLTLIIGITLGICFYKSLHPNFELSNVVINSTLFYNYVLSVLVAMIFSHRKDEITTILVRSQQKDILYTKVQTLNKSLEKKVTARTKKLQEALDTKDRFLRNMSHEIRIPLHGVLNLSTIVNDQWDHLPESKKKLLIEQLANNSSRLMTLVSNLLDISIMTKGKLQLFKSEYDLTQITNNVIKEFISPINQTTIISFENTEPIICVCDKERITQVIRNLISNALRYGDKKSIKIEIKTQKNFVRLSVIDQGVGIPNKELKSIFKQFEESSRTRSTAGGTGLGLSICNEIIKAHEGKIIAKNNQKKGATFYFDLPKPQNYVPVSTIENHSATKQTVLVIDDEEVVLSSTSLMLELLGYHILSASSGFDALKLLEKQIPDIILLDIMMPGMTGDKFLDILRQTKKFKHIPVIVQTGFPNAKELQQMQKLEIIDILKKPYDKQALKAALLKIKS